MKKSYSKAEAYKVSFNACEQVAAACLYSASDYSTKFPLSADASTCVVEGGYYTTAEGTGICFTSEAGIFDGSAYGMGTLDFYATDSGATQYVDAG